MYKFEKTTVVGLLIDLIDWYVQLANNLHQHFFGVIQIDWSKIWITIFFNKLLWEI